MLTTCCTAKVLLFNIFVLFQRGFASHLSFFQKLSLRQQQPLNVKDPVYSIPTAASVRGTECIAIPFQIHQTDEERRRINRVSLAAAPPPPYLAPVKNSVCCLSCLGCVDRSRVHLCVWVSFSLSVANPTKHVTSLGRTTVYVHALQAARVGERVECVLVSRLGKCD